MYYLMHYFYTKMIRIIVSRSYFVSSCTKRYLLSNLFIIGAIISVHAQQQTSNSEGAPDRKTALGIGLRILPYDAVGDPEYQLPALDVPFLFLNYSNSVSDRTTVQVGLGYGMNEAQMAETWRHIPPDSTYIKETYQRLHAVAMPLTIKYTPFKTNKRLQFHGYASLTPMFRRIKARETESLNGRSALREELYNETVSNFTAVASAGITLQYRLSDKWSAYAEGDLIYYSFERQHPITSLRKGAKGIGLNYNLNLRREK